MRAQFLDLAPELVGIILDFIDVESVEESTRRQTLKNISLVCRSLGEITRPRLIHDLSLHSPDDCEAFLESAHRGYLITGLKLAFQDGEDILYQTFSYLSNVKRITLIRSARFPREAMIALRPLLGNVQTLSLEEWENPEALSCLLKAASRVKHLRLDVAFDGSCDCQTFEHEASGPQLESLALCEGVGTLGLPARTLRPFDLSSLRKLELHRFPEDDVLTEVLWLVAGPLEELTVSGWYTRELLVRPTCTTLSRLVQRKKP